MCDDQLPDQDLLRAQQGDRNALERLLRRHWTAAWRAALAVTGRPALAEEAVQEGVIAAVGALGQCDPGRPFAPWLQRIVVNRALNLMRAERRRSAHEADAAVPEVDWAEAQDDHGDILAAVAALPVERRLVVALRYLLDYEPAEIAELLSVPVGTVHSRLGRARNELRARLEVHDVGRS